MSRCLPILFRLYVNKKTAAKKRLRYRRRPELAVEMPAVLCKRQENRRFHVIADSADGGQSVLGQLPETGDLTSDFGMRIHPISKGSGDPPTPDPFPI